MKKHIIALGIVLALTAPGLALACNVTDVDGTFTCDGWEVVVTVDFPEGVNELCVDYAVSLLDFNGDPLEWTAERLCVERPAEDVSTTTVIAVGEWQGTYQGEAFQAAVAAEAQCSEPNGFITNLDCIVSDDEMTWDQIKSQYR